MVLTTAAHCEMIPDGKKHGNLYSITELAYPVVHVYFSLFIALESGVYRIMLSGENYFIIIAVRPKTMYPCIQG